MSIRAAASQSVIPSRAVSTCHTPAASSTDIGFWIPAARSLASSAPGCCVLLTKPDNRSHNSPLPDDIHFPIERQTHEDVSVDKMLDLKLRKSGPDVVSSLHRPSSVNDECKTVSADQTSNKPSRSVVVLICISHLDRAVVQKRLGSFRQLIVGELKRQATVSKFIPIVCSCKNPPPTLGKKERNIGKGSLAMRLKSEKTQLKSQKGRGSLNYIPAYPCILVVTRKFSYDNHTITSFISVASSRAKWKRPTRAARAAMAEIRPMVSTRRLAPHAKRVQPLNFFLDSLKVRYGGQDKTTGNNSSLAQIVVLRYKFFDSSTVLNVTQDVDYGDQERWVAYLCHQGLEVKATGSLRKVVVVADMCIHQVMMVDQSSKWSRMVITLGIHIATTATITDGHTVVASHFAPTTRLAGCLLTIFAIRARRHDSLRASGSEFVIVTHAFAGNKVARATLLS
ncbi:hypothetical protein KCU90_g24, partial [Aureobasidium melanogenum]